MKIPGSLSRKNWGARLATAGALLALTGGAAAILVPDEVVQPPDGRLELRPADAPATIVVGMDKPIYRADEMIHARILVLEGAQRALANSPKWAQVRILGPGGNVVYEDWALSEEDGVYGFRHGVETGWAGGRYKLQVRFGNASGLPSAEREFEVRAFRPPRLRSQVEFAREGYGPGDEVSASLTVSRSEGGIPAGARVFVQAIVDQEVVATTETTVDPSGFASVRFRLPDLINIGDGTLTFTVQDGGLVESIGRTIPILARHVDLEVYPEGGDLVTGVENRVYFEAKAPNGRPADIRAELRDASGAVITTIETEHEGRGRLRFTPQAGNSYTLHVVEPASVQTTHTLPEAGNGLLLESLQDIFAPGEPLRFRLATATDRNVELVLAHKSDEAVRSTFVLNSVEGRDREVTLPPLEALDGIIRVTAYDRSAGMVPLAERLVFVQPRERVTVTVEPDRDRYTPGEKVTLKVRATRPDGTPASGIVGLVVTDDSTLELVEKRLQPPRLPAMVLLETDVKDLADASIYLSEDEKAPMATDLLLGTQGWRRFAFVAPAPFLREHEIAAMRVLGSGPMGAEVFDGPMAIYTARGVMAFGAVAMDAAAPDDRRMRMMEARPEAAARPTPTPASRPQIGALPAVVIADKHVAPQEADAAGAAAGLPQAARQPAREAGGGRLMYDPAQATVSRGDIWRVRNGERYESPEQSYLAVRQYAHKAREDRPANAREDFTETLFFHAGLKVDDNGEAEVSFDLSDSVTSFRVIADALTSTGGLGVTEELIESRRPFYVEVMTPLETTERDRFLLPVVVANETANDVTAAMTFDAPAGMVIGDHDPVVDVPAGSRSRILIPIEIVEGAESTRLMVTAGTGEYTDHVTRDLLVAPLGFPVAVTWGGLLEDTNTYRFVIPTTIRPSHRSGQITLFPSPVSNLTAAVERLIRDPHGCFEQTSSTTYPMLMAVQYLEGRPGTNPELLRTAREKLDAGYKRLIGFETSERGYEWFGGNPGHEALTAYGLLQFTEMSSVMAVDDAMVARTREWLLAARDGEGGFKRNERALDTFGRAPQDITNAYIVWALAMAGEQGIERELDAARQSAMASDDPYLMSLVIGAWSAAGRVSEVEALVEKLRRSQQEDGRFQGASTSITGSRGDSLDVETTALAILCLIDDARSVNQVESAVRWLATQCEAGRFGSTQGTILSLKALLAYEAKRAADRQAGTIELRIDGEVVGRVAFEGDRGEPIVFDQLEALTFPGTRTVTLTLEDGFAMPFAAEVKYVAETPTSSEGAPFDYSVELASERVTEGNSVDVVVTMRNRLNEGLPMSMAVIGLPGGLEPRHDQLKELVDGNVVSYYEIHGRSVVLYFRDFAPSAERRIVLSTMATIPGTWRGSASTAYLYYNDTDKTWLDGLQVTVDPR